MLRAGQKQIIYSKTCEFLQHIIFLENEYSSLIPIMFCAKNSNSHNSLLLLSPHCRVSWLTCIYVIEWDSKNMDI